MVNITEELIRKRSEHNECEITTLEELSLHQEDIEKIEHLQNWCKDLQILLLQSNLISRIENLHKLKRLQYLNLAINNIEVIENLDRCESLEKLDLTLNFIGDLKSVINLKNNQNLKELYLTGNPCTDFKGYRNYVIAHLPQLHSLDSTDVTRTERLKALQISEMIAPEINAQQLAYQSIRKEQRERYKNVNNDHVPDELFWKQESEHCPEVRVEMSKRQRKARAKDESNTKSELKPNVKLFTENERPLNMNQPKLKFVLNDEDPNEIVLDLAIYKYLDTNYLNVDLQPTYVTISVKGKIFQLVLPDEICTSRSVAQRSQTTGHLVVRMVRLNPKPGRKRDQIRKEVTSEVSFAERKQRREYLEIGPDRLSQLCNITSAEMKNLNDNEDDNSEVPPLE